jgi:hypothetical protein
MNLRELTGRGVKGEKSRVDFVHRKIERALLIVWVFEENVRRRLTFGYRVDQH